MFVVWPRILHREIEQSRETVCLQSIPVSLRLRNLVVFVFMPSEHVYNHPSETKGLFKEEFQTCLHIAINSWCSWILNELVLLHSKNLLCLEKSPKIVLWTPSQMYLVLSIKFITSLYGLKHLTWPICSSYSRRWHTTISPPSVFCSSSDKPRTSAPHSRWQIQRMHSYYPLKHIGNGQDSWFSTSTRVERTEKE